MRLLQQVLLAAVKSADTQALTHGGEAVRLLDSRMSTGLLGTEQHEETHESSSAGVMQEHKIAFETFALPA